MGYQASRVLRLEAVGKALCEQLCHDPDAVLKLKGPALELFCFRRICFDEFHEVMNLKQRATGNEALAFNSIRLLRAPRRWGLTATPRIESAADVSAMAEVLQMYVPPDSPEQAQHFLNHFARSNTWDVGTVPLVEHVVKVTLTGRERALYLSEVQHHGAKTERCVQLCSHFSANDACQDSKAAVDSVRESHVQERLNLETRIQAARLKLDAAITPEERNSGAISLGHLQRSLSNLKAATEYFETTLKSLDPAGTSIECSVCLEDASCQTLALTPCGHLFHEECLRSCIHNQGRCPQCMATLDRELGMIPVSNLHS